MPITNDDPMLGQQAEVTAVDSGGFLVVQQPSRVAQRIETYCVNMDAVSALLTQIFTPPAPPPPPGA